MKSLRQQRDLLSKVALTLTGFAAAIVLSFDALGRTTTPTNIARYVVLSATIILAIARWLYDTFIWRLLSPKIDLNGRWAYVHRYTPPVPIAAGDVNMTSNSGWLEIHQTPNSITYHGAREKVNNQPVSEDPAAHSIDFSSIAFDIADSGTGVFLYDVHRDSTTRAMAELRVEAVRDGEPPKKIFVRFRSLEPQPTYSGEGTYIFVSPTRRRADRLVEGYRRFWGAGR